MIRDDAPARIQTPFGTFDLDRRSIVRFPEGLPGYETCREFVLVGSPGLEPLQCLQAVEEPSASFLVADPALLVRGYERDAHASDLDRLEADDPASLLWLSILTLSPDGTVSANLRAPVAINPDRMRGYQIIPVESPHPLRRLLALAG